MAQPSSTDAQHLATLWMLDLSQPLSSGPETRTPASFMRVGPEAAQELTQAMNLEDASLVLQRFARGCQCYIACCNRKFVAYCWVTFDREHIGELDLYFSLKAREAYIWNCSTLPLYRGLRLYPALLAYILHNLQQQKQQRIWICASSDNLASQRGMALAGFQPVADLFLAHRPFSNSSWIRGHPGISEQLIAEISQTLRPSA